MEDSDEPRLDCRQNSLHQEETESRDELKRRRVMRDVLQKKVHNVVEQKRKAKMAAWISDINSLLPKSDPRKESINLVLERAYAFMLQLKEDNDKLLDGKFSEVEKTEFQKLRQEVTHLKQLNERYVKLLRLAGISPALVPPDMPLTPTSHTRPVHKAARFASDDDSSCSSQEEEVMHCRRRRPRRRKSCGRKCQSDLTNGSSNNNSSPQIVVIRGDLPAVIPGASATPTIAGEVSPTDQSALNGGASNLLLSSNLLQTGATYILTANGQLLPVAQVVTSEPSPSLTGGANCSPTIAPFPPNAVTPNHAQPALQANGQNNSATPVVPIIATSSHNFHVSSLLNDGTSSSADAAMPLDPIENTQVGSRTSCNSGSNEFFSTMGNSNSQSMRISYRSNNFHVNNLLTDVSSTPASDPGIQSSVPIESIDQNQMSNRVPTFCSSGSTEYYQPRGQSSHSSNSFRTQTFRSNNFHVNNLLTDVSNSAQPVVESSIQQHSVPSNDMVDKNQSSSRSTPGSYNQSNQSDYYPNRGQTPSSWMNPMARW